MQDHLAGRGHAHRVVVIRRIEHFYLHLSSLTSYKYTCKLVDFTTFLDEALVIGGLKCRLQVFFYNNYFSLNKVWQLIKPFLKYVIH